MCFNASDFDDLVFDHKGKIKLDTKCSEIGNFLYSAMLSFFIRCRDKRKLNNDSEQLIVRCITDLELAKKASDIFSVKSVSFVGRKDLGCIAVKNLNLDTLAILKNRQMEEQEKTSRAVVSIDHKNDNKPGMTER